MRQWWIIAIALLMASCTGDRACRSPFGNGGTIDITLPEFSALSHPGGALTLNCGYRGVFVTRVSYSEFVAFECACPVDNEVRLLPDAEWGNSILSCSACGSRFNALDGTPLDGATTSCLLYQYGTQFDGRNLTIY